jgi:Holliday junction resolvase RusA-like endonuclease
VCDKKPDIDNAYKPIADVMEAIGLIRNDSLVCHADVWTLYHQKNGRSGAVIQLKSCPPIPSHVMWLEGLRA